MFLDTFNDTYNFSMPNLDSMDDTCLICLDSLDDEVWICESCRMCAHWQCVTKWWARGKGCPHCRRAEMEEVVENLIGESVTTLESITLVSLMTVLLVSSGNTTHVNNIFELD